jgi:hypothetical protein
MILRPRASTFNLVIASSDQFDHNFVITTSKRLNSSAFIMILRPRASTFNLVITTSDQFGNNY